MLYLGFLAFLEFVKQFWVFAVKNDKNTEIKENTIAEKNFLIPFLYCALDYHTLYTFQKTSMKIYKDSFFFSDFFKKINLSENTKESRTMPCYINQK